MSYDWGPHFIVPTSVLKTYSGIVKLREELDDELLQMELGSIGLPTTVVNISNPWYYRKKGAETWIKIGESNDRHENFPVTWDTSWLDNGDYEVLGAMHVFVKTDGEEGAIARHCILEVAIEN